MIPAERFAPTDSPPVRHPSRQFLPQRHHWFINVRAAVPCRNFSTASNCKVGAGSANNVSKLSSKNVERPRRGTHALPERGASPAPVQKARVDESNMRSTTSPELTVPTLASIAKRLRASTATRHLHDSGLRQVRSGGVRDAPSLRVDRADAHAATASWTWDVCWACKTKQTSNQHPQSEQARLKALPRTLKTF